MYQGQPWHGYYKTSDNRVSRLIGPNGAYPDVTRSNGIYCTTVLSISTSESVVTELLVKLPLQAVSRVVLSLIPAFSTFEKSV